MNNKYGIYCENDIINTTELKLKLNGIYGTWSTKSIPEIQKVIFNDPATIVFWVDNTKTIVKCQEGDMFDPEKGLAMAISKKALGNQGNYCNVIKKWTDNYWCEQALSSMLTFQEVADKLAKASKNIGFFIDGDKRGE